MPATSGYITRAVGGNLAIVNDTYDVFYDDATGLDIGTVSWNRITADSPFSSGRVMVQAVKGTPMLNMRVNVLGADLSTVQTNVGTLLAAVWATSYELSLTLDTGATYTWACEPADATVGVTYSHVLGRICPVVLSIPRSPIPVSGPI